MGGGEWGCGSVLVAYEKQRKVEQAVTYYQEAINIYHEIGSPLGAATWTQNLEEILKPYKITNRLLTMVTLHLRCLRNLLIHRTVWLQFARYGQGER